MSTSSQEEFGYLLLLCMEASSRTGVIVLTRSLLEFTFWAKRAIELDFRNRYFSAGCPRTLAKLQSNVRGQLNLLDSRTLLLETPYSLSKLRAVCSLLLDTLNLQRISIPSQRSLSRTGTYPQLLSALCFLHVSRASRASAFMRHKAFAVMNTPPRIIITKLSTTVQARCIIRFSRSSHTAWRHPPKAANGFRRNEF
jgi:hypothetical protein